MPKSRPRQNHAFCRNSHAGPAATGCVHCMALQFIAACLVNSYSFTADVRRSLQRSCFEFPTFRRQGTCPKELEVQLSACLLSVNWTVFKCIETGLKNVKNANMTARRWHYLGGAPFYV